MPDTLDQTTKPRIPGAQRVLVISLMKSGTHLIQELMTGLGYSIYGQSRTPPEVLPQLTAAERRRMSRVVFGVDAGDGDAAWNALGWAWQTRFGLPLASRYGAEVIHAANVEQALRNTTTRFSDTPSGVCWILPELNIEAVDGQFIQEWVDTGEPRLIFVYRDPRDALLSMINFLLGKTGKGYGNFADFHVYSAILANLESDDARIRYALSAPQFPGRDDTASMEWLLHHPNVCKVSFEELVGPRGGGNIEAQRDAVQRVMHHIDDPRPPETVSDSIFSTDSFTFHKGQIGSWRESYSEENAALAYRVFARALNEYGYEVTASGGSK